MTTQKRKVLKFTADLESKPVSSSAIDWVTTAEDIGNGRGRYIVDLESPSCPPSLLQAVEMNYKIATALEAPEVGFLDVELDEEPVDSY
jgi:hypothetical protein